jgi:penicillin-binding protein 1B
VQGNPVRIEAKKILSIIKKVFWGLMALALGYVVVLLAMVIWLFEYRLHQWPGFVYTAPYTFRVGDDITRNDLLERLNRLGYSSAQFAVPDPGEWHQSGSGININLRHSHFTDLGMVSGPISVSLDWNRIRSIRLMRSVEDVDQVTLEPEILYIVPGSGFGPEFCRPAVPDKVPSLLVDAILLTEDVRFYDHQGIDFEAIRLALVTNVKAGRYVQGGSTIPQQVMRMTLLSPEKTMGRKINEVALAVIADALYEKDTILQAYLNRVYFGQWGAFPVRGVREATRLFFGKDLPQLDSAECALLAALIRAPNVINPYRHPERALGRRNMVLGLLFKAGKLSREEYEEATASPVKMRKPGASPVRATAFVDLVKDSLPQGFAEASTLAGRPGVCTSLDPLLQMKAESLVKTLGEAGAQTHFILANPQTGALRAFLAPGPAKWNGAGGNAETFLPFIVIPGLIAQKRDDAQFTLTSPIFVPERVDASITFREAFTTQRTFLVRKLLTSLAKERVLSSLKEFGIQATRKGDQDIGVEPMVPLEVAQCYATLAALGNSAALGPAVSYFDRGNVAATARKRVSISPSVLFIVNHLTKMLTPGSPKDGAQEKAWMQPSVWTATDEQGLWGIAYRPDLLVLVRVPGRSVREEALRKKVLSILSDQDLSGASPPPVPEGVVFQKICVQSGLRATSVCPHVIREPFLKGTQPTEWCPLRHDSASVRSELAK